MHHRCCTLVFQLSNKLINPPPPNRLHMTQREDYKRSIGGRGVGEIQKRNCNKKYLGQWVTQIDNISLIAQSNKKKKKHHFALTMLIHNHTKQFLPFLDQIPIGGDYIL